MTLEERVLQLEQELLDLRESMHSLPLELHDSEGNKRIEIVSVRNDTALKFYNSQGKQTLSVGVDGTESGYLSIMNAEGRVVAKLDVETYGARLELLDSYWKSGASVVMHGNDCNNEGGWIKVLPGTGDDEVMIAVPGEKA